MKLIEFLLLWCVLSSLKKSAWGEQYVLAPVINITEISGDVKTLPYLKQYPGADTDVFGEEKRLELCQHGFGLVEKSEQEKKIEFLDNVATGTLKAYVLLDSILLNEQNVEAVDLVAAFKCPTNPPTYIQVNLDDGNQHPMFLVIIKANNRPTPTLEQIVNYKIQKADEITEANVDMINSKYRYGLQFSSYDSDELSEEARFEVCRRGVQTILNAGIRFDVQFLENDVTGLRKFYAVIKEFGQEDELFIQAFDCPTEPKVRIHVRNGKKGYVVQTFIERYKIKRSAITFTSDPVIGRISRSTSDKVGEELNAVVSCPSSAYLQARKQNSRRKDIIDPETKNRICLSIMGSSKYTYFNNKPINMYTISEDVYLKYPEIFETEQDISDFAFSSFFTVYKPINPTKSMNVYLRSQKDRKPVSENVFTCLTQWESKHGKIECREYFISEEYNMNNASDASINYIPGRFIFAYDDKDRVELYSVAEEPAQAVLVPDSLFRNIELLYLQKSSLHQPAEKESDDPLCRLTEKEKYRLCGLIFNSKFYDGVYFPPSSHVTGHNRCYRYTVSFRNEDVRALTNGEEYQEWMIVCYMSVSPYDYRTDSTKEYFLSRAYESWDTDALSANDVFVYQRKSTPDGIYLQNSFTNVRLKFLEENSDSSKLTSGS